MGKKLEILIVGGEIAGMSCAISLARSGHEVRLVDLDPEWRPYGAGISIQAATFRALDHLGLAKVVAEKGAACRGARLRLADGTLVKEVAAHALEPGLPGGGGILRPVLHDIMAAETRRSGVTIRLGLTVERVEEEDGGVNAMLSDGSEERYDAIVAADGIFSRMREMVFPGAPKPRFTGQGAFRVMAPRPADLDMIETFMGNPVKAGVTPVSPDELYMFVLTPERADDWLEHDLMVARLRETLAGFGGLIAEIRDSLGPDSRIIYRPLMTIFLEKPWHEGRVVLIGDAVHATTPQLASGAGSAMEDGIILAEMLTACGTVEEACRRFTERRFERCRHVVESSVRLGEMELAGCPGEEQGRVYAEAIARLAEPA